MTDAQKEVIRSAVAAVIKKGYTIRCGGFGDGVKTCCPIRAVSLESDRSSSFIETAMWVLQTRNYEVWQFIYGFDGAYGDEYNGFYKFGKELRRELNV